MNISRIILADDSSILLTGLVQLLKTEFPEAEIKAVETGQALLKEITLKKWDVAISDIDMPGRSGLEILEQIKLLRPNLPVLILSMYKEDIYAARVMKAGAAGYLVKTSAAAELIHAVHHIATGKKYITAEIAERLLDSFKRNKKAA
ncbi:MAG: response regulator transcription factor [Ferruginibacter sp.]